MHREVTQSCLVMLIHTFCQTTEGAYIEISQFVKQLFWTILSTHQDRKEANVIEDINANKNTITDVTED